MTMVGKQIGANRVVEGVKIPHPCGDPTLPEVSDLALRREIIERAIRALQTNVNVSTVFTSNVTNPSE